MSNPSSISDRIGEAVDHIKSNLLGDLQPKVGIVLGSGLGAVADAMETTATASYGEIPGFHTSTVEGHAGRLCLGKLGGTPVALMQGRIHLYEGHPVEDVVRPVRVLVSLGCEKLLITNAAGGIHGSFVVGDLMLIRDHLNLTFRNPLVGPNDDSLGPRFPDMTHAYDPELRTLAHRTASEQGIELREGVYAGLLGPSYETPAEIRMLRTLGADAVGMSTVLEVIAAHHMGAKCVGLSCISNVAAGLSDAKLSHDEVKAAADSVQDKLTKFVVGLAGAM